MPTSVTHIAADWRRRAVATCHRLGCSSEDGQSLVMASICIVAMLFVAALLVDGGMAYTQRRVMQNAADAAALAGVRELAYGARDGEILQAVNEYAVSRNAAKKFTATYVPGGETVGDGSVPKDDKGEVDADGVVVNTKTDFATFFAKVMGRSQMTVTASAKATMGGVSSPGPSAQPLAKFCDKPDLKECGFEFDVTYNIWDGLGSGNFGWLSFNGDNDAPYVIQELQHGSPVDYVDPHGQCSQLAIGCWVQGLPGVSNGSGVHDALDWWKDNRDQPMTIIIYDQTEGQGANGNYRIAGFASFELVNYSLPQGGGNGNGNGNGNNGGGGSVMGKFKKWVTPGQVDDNAGNYGLVSYHLSH